MSEGKSAATPQPDQEGNAAFERLLRESMAAAVRLAITRHNLELDPDAATEEEISYDAAGACFGEECCDDTMIPEVAQLMNGVWLAGSVAAPKAHSFAEECAAQAGHALIVQCSCGSEFKPQCPDCHEIAGAPKAGEPPQELLNEIAVGVEKLRWYTADEGWERWNAACDGIAKLLRTGWPYPSWRGAGETPAERIGDSECKICGKPNPTWFAPNELWNKVVPERSGVLCPACFIAKAESQGVSPTAWMLIPETDQHLSPELRSRIALKIGQGRGILLSKEELRQLYNLYSLPPGAGSTKEGK